MKIALMSMGLVAASIAGVSSATFTSYSAVSGGSQGGLTKYSLLMWKKFSAVSVAPLKFAYTEYLVRPPELPPETAE